MSRRSATILALFLAVLAAAMAWVAGALYSSGSADFAAQDIQPVDFSHKLHAGDLSIACLFCHRHATESPTATVPSVALCIGCHRSIDDEAPEVRKLFAYWNEQKPIPWVRLQRLPDFVYFTHEMHMKKGLQCVSCHGDVQRVRYTPRAASFEMGWCLTCHQQQGASRDCLTCHK
jgi:hypothetical protein